MSDNKKKLINEEELDKVTGGTNTETTETFFTAPNNTSYQNVWNDSNHMVYSTNKESTETK